MHSIFNAAYCAKFEGYDFLMEVARSCDFPTGIELSIFTDKPDFMKNMLARRSEFHGIPLTLHGPFNDVEAASAPGSEERGHILDAYKYSFDLYEEFGAHSIVMHTHRMKNIPAENMDTLRGWSIETVNKIAEMAFARHIRLTVENVGTRIHNNCLFNDDQFIEMFSQLPEDTGCLIDVGHALINRWDLFHVIHSLNSRICSYHLHNNNGNGDQHLPMFADGNRYTASEMRNLLLVMNECSPGAEWILEYAPGEHITKELLVRDMRILNDIHPTEGER